MLSAQDAVYVRRQEGGKDVVDVLERRYSLPARCPVSPLPFTDRSVRRTSLSLHSALCRQRKI